MYPEFRPRYFLTFLGFSWAWGFPGLQAQEQAQANKSNPEPRNRPKPVKKISSSNLNSEIF